MDVAQDSRLSFVAGYPVRYLNDNVLENNLEAVWDAVPVEWSFRTLSENRAWCARVTLEGDWKVEDIRLGHLPPAETVGSWFRKPYFIPDVCRFCPQVILRLLLLQLQLGIDELGRVDLGQPDLFPLLTYNAQYNVLKNWLQRAVLPAETWDDIADGWSLDPLESENYKRYRRVFSNLLNSEDALSSNWSVAAPGAGSTAPVSLSEFQRMCPQIDRVYDVRTSGGNHIQAVVGPLPLGMAMLGNSLSMYWQARGVAGLAGVAFEAEAGQGFGFVRHLPRIVPAPVRANHKLLAALCRSCSSRLIATHPHICLGAWTTIQEQVGVETRRALQINGAADRARVELGDHDVAISLRCTPSFNSDYPLAGFSLYDSLPEPFRSSARLRFLLVAGHVGSTCYTVAVALERFLQRRYPHARTLRFYGGVGDMSDDLAEQKRVLSQHSGGDAMTERDFALLVYAPVLFRGPGSFSLWAGLARDAGRNGLVLSTPNPADERANSTWTWSEADFGRHWQWVHAPLLTLPVIHQHGFVFGSPSPWITWLETH